MFGDTGRACALGGPSSNSIKRRKDVDQRGRRSSDRITIRENRCISHSPTFTRAPACILHFAANSVAFLSLLQPANNVHEHADWRISRRFFASKFLCPPKSCHGNILLTLYLLRAASDAFDVQTRTRFKKVHSPSGGAMRNNQSERNTRDWFDSGNDMIYILVLLQKLRQL